MQINHPSNAMDYYKESGNLRSGELQIHVSCPM